MTEQIENKVVQASVKLDMDKPLETHIINISDLLRAYLDSIEKKGWIPIAVDAFTDKIVLVRNIPE